MNTTSGIRYNWTDGTSFDYDIIAHGSGSWKEGCFQIVDYKTLGSSSFGDWEMVSCENKPATALCKEKPVGATF